MRNLKLRPAITIILCIGFLLPTLVAGWLTINNQKRVLLLESSNEHKRIVNLLALTMQEPLWAIVPEAAQPIVDALMADERIIKIIVESDEGIFVEKYSSTRPEKDIQSLSQEVNYFGKNIGKVEVFFSTERITQTIAHQTNLYLLIFIIPFILSSAAIFAILHGKVIKPIDTLINQAKNLAGQGLHQPIDWKQKDEMGLLGKSLEQARQALSALFSNLEQMKERADDRSNELSKINQQLENEIAERTRIESELRDHKDQLENIVQQRTQALTNANKNLLSVIKEREHAEQERKKIELKLHRAEKMEALGILASGVAHDLNNILAGVASYPEILMHKLDKDDKLQAPLKIIHDSGKRAAAVVADLLTIARGVASSKTLRNLNSLIDEHLVSPEHTRILALYPEVTVNFTNKAEQSTILCSSVHIRKCLMNLINNAAEAINGCGRIDIETENRHQNTNLADQLKPQPAVVLTIRDNGPGIPEDNIDNIFEPFYTTKHLGRSGSGLGLAVVWNTMLDHKGTVAVENSDQGTCFTLWFPIIEDSLVVPAREIGMKAPQGSGESVLIVDDEPSLLLLAQEILTELNYKVHTIPSGEGAVNYLKEHNVDLVLLDMIMEPGINGRETYEQIIQIHPDQKAIIVSGFAINDEIQDTLNLGAAEFLQKPYSFLELGRAVRSALDRP